MSGLAVIGGTGLHSLNGLEIQRREVKQTPYGEPSSPLVHGLLCGKEIVFMMRHGVSHAIPPHRVNYRANLWALKDIGIEKLISIAAVGGITSEFAPSRLAFPDQIIDYTWSRANTFFEDGIDHVRHIDFTRPYCERLRQALIRAAEEAGIEALASGTYGAMQGPRLETAAEIDRLERDGCDMVGMTGMPEAALARELELCYATCAVVANRAAGRGREPLSMKVIEANLEVGIRQVQRLLEHVVPMA